MFKNAYIPKRLTEVIDFERDINQVKSGILNDLVYKTLVGLKPDLSGTVEKPEILENVNAESDGEEESGSENSEEEGSKFVDASRPKHETADEKKLRKKAIKDAKAEKRKVKVKKHVKKRKEKITKK